MVRFQIQAVERTNFQGCSRAGRFWPSAKAVDVVVHDQDDDPPAGTDKEGKSLLHSENPRNIGRLSFESIKADRRLRIINAGDPMAVETEVVSHLRAKFDASWSDLKRTHAVELERAEEHQAAAELALAEALAKIAELEARADHAEEEAISLMDKLAALKGGGETEVTGDHDPAPGQEITKPESPKGKGKKKDKGGDE